MKKNKVNNISNKLMFTEDDARILLDQYRNLFADAKSYNELVTLVLSYLQLLQQNIQNSEVQYNYSTVLFMLKEKMMYFICEKIKQGDINLEINIVEQYTKHSNLIKPRFDKLVIHNAQKESYQKYKQLTEIHTNLEKDFVNKLWEDSIIETIETYHGNNTFAGEIFQNFKNKISKVDVEFEQFINTRPKVKTLNGR